MFEHLQTPPEGEELLTEHLATICERLKNSGLPVEHIILIGSYGRGEGAFIRNGTDLCPVNDYDLLVISEQPFSYSDRRTLRKLSNDLAEQLGVWHVDLIAMTHNELCSPEPSMVRYDAKFAGKVIVGGDDLLSLIPFSSDSPLPNSQYLDLLCNRLVTILEAYPGIDVAGVHTEELLSHRARQLAKVYFALVDSLIGRAGGHKSYYREKLALLQEDTSELGRALWKHQAWMIEAWNRQQVGEGGEYVGLWKEIANLFCEEIRFRTSQEVEIPIIENVTCLSNWRGKTELPSFRLALRKLLGALFSRSYRFDVEKELFLSINYLYTDKPSKEVCDQISTAVASWYRSYT